MNWITAAVILLGVMVCLSRKSRPEEGEKQPRAIVPQEPSLADRISDAVADGDLQEMVRLLGKTDTPMDRHHLLSALVGKAYAERIQPDMRKQLYEYGQIYTDEFDEIHPHLKDTGENGDVNAPVFKCMAIAMEEDMKFEEALALCQRALDYNLVDGTKTGYEGRIKRIRRKQDAV